MKRKRGRPKMENPSQRLSIRIQVLVTPDEMNTIKRLMKPGESASSFCRAALLKSLVESHEASRVKQ
jgi:hypothetical protein